MDRVVAEFDPESVHLYRDATSARLLPAVTAYLHTRHDRELGAATQQRSAQVLEAAWTEELATGHLAMAEDPAGVARAVRRLLAPVPGR